MSDDYFLPRATALPIMAVGVEEGGPFQGRTCYSLQGTDGIYRRVARGGRGLEAGDGNVVAHVGKKLIEVRQWVAMEDSLRVIMGVDDGGGE